MTIQQSTPTCPPTTELAEQIVHVAIREAGRLIVARHFGFDGTIALWMNDDLDDDDDHPDYREPAHVLGALQIRSGRRQTRDQVACIAVAGLAAQHLADVDLGGEEWQSGVLLDLINGMAPGALRDMDIGQVMGWSLDECGQVLRDRWPAVVAEAAVAIDRLRLAEVGDTDAMMERAFALASIGVATGDRFRGWRQMRMPGFHEGPVVRLAAQLEDLRKSRRSARREAA